MGADAKDNLPPLPAADERAATAMAQPITAAQFLSWKQRKDAEGSARKAEAAQKHAADSFRSGTNEWPSAISA